MENLKEIFEQNYADLVTDATKEQLEEELKNNYKQVIQNLRLKLKEAGLPSQIGIAPCLLDLYINDNIVLAYHRSFKIELCSANARYAGPAISVTSFEKLACRLIDLKLSD